VVLSAPSDHAVPFLPPDPAEEGLEAIAMDGVEPAHHRLPLLSAVRLQLHHATERG